MSSPSQSSQQADITESSSSISNEQSELPLIILNYRNEPCDDAFRYKGPCSHLSEKPYNVEMVKIWSSNEPLSIESVTLNSNQEEEQLSTNSEDTAYCFGKTQHLTLDFTSIEGVDDNEVVINKCNDLFNLLESDRLIKKLKVFPEDKFPKPNICGEKQTEQEVEETLTKTQKKAMHWIGKDNVINATFSGKDTCHCEVYPSDYDVQRNADFTKKKMDMLTGKKMKEQSESHAVKVQKLCDELEEWDLIHPKCMEPPGHPPTLAHAHMQRTT